MRVDNIAALTENLKQEQKTRPEVRTVKQGEATPATSHRALRFQKHQGAERWMAQVVDVYRNEVIREIPNRQVLDVVAEMRSLLGKLQDSRC